MLHFLVYFISPSQNWNIEYLVSHIKSRSSLLGERDGARDARKQNVCIQGALDVAQHALFNDDKWLFANSVDFLKGSNVSERKVHENDIVVLLA
jgi:hypothetical protein